MAEEEQQGEAETTGGSKKTLIFIILGVVLLIGGSVGGTLLIVGGGDSAEAEVEEEVEVSRGDASYIDLKPAFTVNLAPEDPVGFLQISMQVLTFDDDVAEELEKHRPLIRNNLVVLFGKQKSAELRAPEGKERLQKSALETVQTVINKHGSGGEVDNVFFTSFVMQ
ncbi:MAG: flagellar basal body-associated FliL family protein [Gammaproteobacteria bacterium]|nr:flagellar basal body-associated FliL family protein [Gammaproteobacteria bacterium]MDH3858400.1 flagellar basal body-associated FliL family protein [Gammaproteobacteria bacterium]